LILRSIILNFNNSIENFLVVNELRLIKPYNHESSSHSNEGHYNIAINDKVVAYGDLSIRVYGGSTA
jgi:hypothetical protein